MNNIEESKNDQVGNQFKECTYQDILNNLRLLNNKQLREVVNSCMWQIQKNSFKWMYSKGCNYISKSNESDYYKMSSNVIDDFTQAMEI